jgi:hypothetical protein
MICDAIFQAGKRVQQQQKQQFNNIIQQKYYPHHHHHLLCRIMHQQRLGRPRQGSVFKSCVTHIIRYTSHITRPKRPLARALRSATLGLRVLPAALRNHQAAVQQRFRHSWMHAHQAIKVSLVQTFFHCKGKALNCFRGCGGDHVDADNSIKVL